MARGFSLLLALALAACAAGPPASLTTGSPAPSPTPTPTSTPTPAPTARPTATPTATPLPLPSSQTNRIMVEVYDDQDALLPGVSLRLHVVQGLPYDEKATPLDGRWVFDNVPATAYFELAAEKPGWTSRTARGAFQIPETPHDVAIYLGGPLARYGRGDAPKPDLYLSPYPEVTGVALYDLAKQARLEVDLSEPLDEANRQRFADGVRFMPANAAAAQGQAYFGDLTQSQAPSGFKPDDYPGVLRPGRDLTLEWLPNGRQLKLFFPREKLIGTGEARYQVVLVSTGAPVVDADGHELGLDELGRRGGQVPAGQLVRDVFWKGETNWPGGRLTEAARWSRTHGDAGPIAVQRILDFDREL